mmetsp:Transcript_21521/g.50619  ORF Transcript_21521/g.50619 Transcript_21521/m.50619 type:complete len:473 (+) Transcript_21521:2-1420(+)
MAAPQSDRKSGSLDRPNYHRGMSLNDSSLDTPLFQDRQKTEESCWRKALDQVKALKSLPVFFACIALVGAGTLQRVAFKRLGYSLGPYPYFVLLSISFCFVPIFFFLVAVIIKTAGGFLPETTTLSFKRHFGIIGVMNGLNGLLMVFSNPHVPGTMQALFLQFVMPFTLFFSVVYLKLHFRIGHYCGAALILVGLAVELTPSLIGGGQQGSMFWSLVYIGSQVPLAFGAVYQEKAFSKAKVNVAHLMAWASLGQFFFVLFCIPLNFIPKFGNVPPDEFGHHIHDAALCLANKLDGSPTCSNAALGLFLCVLSMLLANVFQAVVVKYGSAALCVVIQTLVTPVSTLAFTMPWLMGDDTEKMSAWTWAALAVLMLGICLYRYVDLKHIAHRESVRKSLVVRHSMESELDDASAELQIQYDRDQKPVLVSSGIGIIASEYTNEGSKDVPILYEHTLRSAKAASTLTQFRDRSWST